MKKRGGESIPVCGNLSPCTKMSEERIMEKKARKNKKKQTNAGIEAASGALLGRKSRCTGATVRHQRDEHTAPSTKSLISLHRDNLIYKLQQLPSKD